MPDYVACGIIDPYDILPFLLGATKLILRVPIWVGAVALVGPLVVLLSLLKRRELHFSAGDELYVVASKPSKSTLRNIYRVCLRDLRNL